METFIKIPDYWSKIEEEEDFIIFEDKMAEFSVNIDIDPGCTFPFSISLQQLKGSLTRISFEDDLYSTHAKILDEALEKAGEMMEFIDSKRSSIIPVVNRLYLETEFQNERKFPVHYLDEASNKAKSLIKEGCPLGSLRLVNEKGELVGRFKTNGEIHFGRK